MNFKKIKRINPSVNYKKMILIFISEIENLLINNQKIDIALVKNFERKYNFDLREWGYLKMSTFIKKF